MTPVEYDICETQGRIYEYAAKQGINMEVFSPAYLESDFCLKGMDTSYSRFQLESELECWDFIEPELSGKLIKYAGDKCFDGAVAYWIGFTYRQTYVRLGIKSKLLSKVLDFNTMCNYYPGLHTIDEEAALDIIKDNMEKRFAFVPAVKKSEHRR